MDYSCGHMNIIWFEFAKLLMTEWLWIYGFSVFYREEGTAVYEVQMKCLSQIIVGMILLYGILTILYTYLIKIRLYIVFLNISG